MTTEERQAARRAALFPMNHPVRCSVDPCPDAIVKFESGYFITFGHAGFNSPANNGLGYGSAGIAAGAIRRYAGRGKKVAL